MTENVEEPKTGKKRKLIDWKWAIPVAIALVGLIVQFAIAPIIGLPESENKITGKFWVSGEDIPPLSLIYTLSDQGHLQTEYNPSFLYTLQIDQQLVFLNPMLWAPSKTYYAPYEDCKLVRVERPEHISYEKVNSIGVSLSQTTNYFDKQRSSLDLVWQLSHCSVDKVTLQTRRSDTGLRVQISNDYDYPVQYLGIVTLPPIKTNTLYMIEDCRPTLYTSQSIEVRTEDGTRHELEVNLPVIIELPEHKLVTFDIQILKQPPKISLVLQIPTTVATPGYTFAVLGVAVMILVGAILLLILKRRRV